MRAAKPKVHSLLEQAFRDYHTDIHVGRDPISLVHAYRTPEDKEVVAFLVALLSYGNVKMILRSAGQLLAHLGKNPSEAIAKRTYSGKLRDFKHRFTTGEDVEILLDWMSAVIRQNGSLENFFCSEVSGSAPMQQKLSSFVQRLQRQPSVTHPETTVSRRSRNLKYLLSDPGRGSACKRLNMFLRWVVRPEDGVDLGIWSKVQPRELMLPVDTHLLKTLQLLGWTKSKQANWKVVEAATEKLRLYCVEDPIRYDFALCHLSMSGKSLAQYR